MKNYFCGMEFILCAALFLTALPPFAADAAVGAPLRSAITVAIDAGHQQHGDARREPTGPGSPRTKARVSSGTRGAVSRVPEYALNLDNAFCLKKELESRGYKVIMSRVKNDVSISNRERTLAASMAGADILVHIHANAPGPGQPADARGAMTLCITKDNPFHPKLYAKSRFLADSILDALTASTGAAKIGVWETDTMSGLNWSSVPSVTAEVGYMTNATEDRLMQTGEYRKKIARGIADGIDAFFAAFAAR